MLMNGMCMVCNDVKKYSNAVYNAQRITRYIMGITEAQSVVKDDLSREEWEFYNNLRYAGKQVHFMCGQCYKVNVMKLTNAENQLKKELVYLVRLLKSTTDEKEFMSYKEQGLRSLQGFYPLMYQKLNEIRLNNK